MPTLARVFVRDGEGALETSNNVALDVWPTKPWLEREG
jgi:hypothetical protein